MARSELFHHLQDLLSQLSSTTPEQQALMDEILQEIDSIEMQLREVADSFNALLAEPVQGNGGGDSRPATVPVASWDLFKQVRFSGNPVDKQTLKDLLNQFPALKKLPHN